MKVFLIFSARRLFNFFSDPLYFFVSVAQEQGILTELDAEENARLRKSMKEEDWSWILDDNNTNTLEENALQQLKGGQCSNDTKECSPHGVCISNECRCAVAFSG